MENGAHRERKRCRCILAQNLQRIPIDPATPVRFHFGGSYRSEDLFIRCFDPNGRPSWTGRYFTYHINPTVTPKTIDLFRRLFGGPGSSEASPEPAAIGIYEIAGDQLRIHLTERQPALQEDVQRPKAFRIESDSGDILFVLEQRRPSEDLRAFLGKWALIAQFEDGRPLADDKLRRREYLFSELSISVLEKTDYATLDDVLQGEFVLDAARHPKRITITSYYDFSNKKSEKRELLGIYEIGGDHLRIAYRPGGAAPRHLSPTSARASRCWSYGDSTSPACSLPGPSRTSRQNRRALALHRVQLRAPRCHRMATLKANPTPTQRS